MAPAPVSNLFCNRPQLRLSQDLSCFEGRMTFAWKGLHASEKLILNLGSRLHNTCDTQQSTDRVVNMLSFLFWLCSVAVWVLSSLAWDQTQAPCSGSVIVFAAGPPESPCSVSSIARPLLSMQQEAAPAVPTSQHSAHCLKLGSGAEEAPTNVCS